MDCQIAVGLYDAWRDQELEPKQESSLIAHLESCETCSLDFEIRDEALGALQSLSEEIPSLPLELQQKISDIKPRRRPSMAWFSGMVAAFFLGFYFQAILFPGLFEPNRLSPQQLAQFDGRVSTVAEQFEDDSQVMAGFDDEIQLIRRGQGSRLTLVRGDGLAQQNVLKSLKLKHQDWAGMIDPLLEDQNEPVRLLKRSQPEVQLINFLSESIFGGSTDSKKEEFN